MKKGKESLIALALLVSKLAVLLFAVFRRESDETVTWGEMRVILLFEIAVIAFVLYHLIGIVYFTDRIFG